ncbi:MAG: N-acetylglucosamine-6-phosphate deacetylase [Fervidobacterium sp.]
MILEDVLIVDPIDGEYVGSIEFDDKIHKVRKSNKNSYKSIVMPAFVDPHIHGIRGIDTMTASYDDFLKFKEYEALEGVWYFLPTTVTSPIEKLKDINLPGGFKLHLEGPFISEQRKGAHNEKYIITPPKDLTEIQKLILPEKIELITAAPENDNFFNFAKDCLNHNIKISLGHSNANFQVAKKAFESGFKRITHFPNALSPLHHRDLNMVGAGLYLDFTVEMIVDGVHSSPEFVDFVFKIKGSDKIILVTDSISATGLKDGDYMLGDLPVKVRGGKAQLKDGTIAGSTLRFSQAVKNFHRFTKCTLKELAKVSSYNACKDLGIEGGRLLEGYPARFVELDGDLNIKKTWNF